MAQGCEAVNDRASSMLECMSSFHACGVVIKTHRRAADLVGQTDRNGANMSLQPWLHSIGSRAPTLSLRRFFLEATSSAFSSSSGRRRTLKDVPLVIPERMPLHRKTASASTAAVIRPVMQHVIAE
ncbi:unnamed protein product [Symbiodinium sp. CCMP2592]|nr:unnamed protein product [Symbiodinium sp. CCMP2592]